MRTPRRRLLALASVAGVVATLAVPAAAQAAYFGNETDYATSGSPSGYEFIDYKCSVTLGGKACFKPAGDVFYVLDDKADGRSAAADWVVWGDETRTGSCVNKLGAGKWGVCNKNFQEDQEISMSVSLYDSGNFVDGYQGNFVEWRT